MIALVRMNLACLITKRTSSVRISDVPYSLSLHSFSTWRNRQVVTTHKVYELLLHKHQFSPEVSSLAASHLTEIRSAEKADLILSFLQECGFASSQLEKIVKYRPRILSHSVEDIKFKIKTFQDLGLSLEDISKMISSNMNILHLSVKNNIIPTLSLLNGLLGSNNDVARLIRRSGWVILADLEKTLLPNIELLKSCGIPMERILFLLYAYPRCLLIKPDIMRKSVDKAKEMGFSECSKMFIHAVRVIVPMSKGKWEVKLQAFRDFGFSDSDIFAMFKKSPQAFCISMKKIEKVKQLLLATGKFNMSSIVLNPTCFGFSIEKRYKPRLRILEILENRNLIKKWPGLSNFCKMTDDKFFKEFIGPYSNELGDIYITKS